MEDKEALEIIIKKIKSMKDVDNISLPHRFKEDLGFDSVDMLEIVLFIENEFKISLAHPFTILTVQDALDFITGKIN